jgi:electron transport complex protein RnfG
MKKTILIPVLAVLLCAALLLGVSSLTAGMYLDNSRELHLKDLQTLLPGATEFTVEPYDGEDANILSVHKADIGYVIETNTYGYAGPITVLVGVNKDGKVTGLVVRDMQETPGLGANALTDADFLAQFLNKTGSFAIGAPGADAFSGATAAETTGEEIYVDGITGATVTSKAIARCVNSAVGYVTGADVESGATSWGG